MFWRPDIQFAWFSSILQSHCLLNRTLITVVITTLSYLIIGPRDRLTTVPAGMCQFPGSTSTLTACLDDSATGGKYLQYHNILQSLKTGTITTVTMIKIITFCYRHDHHKNNSYKLWQMVLFLAFPALCIFKLHSLGLGLELHSLGSEHYSLGPEMCTLCLQYWISYTWSSQSWSWTVSSYL